MLLYDWSSEPADQSFESAFQFCVQSHSVVMVTLREKCVLGGLCSSPRWEWNVFFGGVCVSAHLLPEWWIRTSGRQARALRPTVASSTRQRMRRTFASFMTVGAHGARFLTHPCPSWFKTISYFRKFRKRSESIQMQSLRKASRCYYIIFRLHQ